MTSAIFDHTLTDGARLAPAPVAWTAAAMRSSRPRMNDIFRLDRLHGLLSDRQGRRFDPAARAWGPAGTSARGDAVDAITAATWLQRQSGTPIRIPIGVIGPREASAWQKDTAEAIGRGIGTMGFAVICGGRQGIMEAACKGVSDAGGVAIGMLPEPDPACANPHVGIIIATGIGEARNALIARAALCLVAIGDSFGTLSEVALGRQFGKCVIGLEGAAHVDGVVHVANVDEALQEVARCALNAQA
jgi:uncharacterized protein (TIGR00725 family)